MEIYLMVNLTFLILNLEETFIQISIEARYRQIVYNVYTVQDMFLLLLLLLFTLARV